MEKIVINNQRIIGVRTEYNGLNREVTFTYEDSTKETLKCNTMFEDFRFNTLLGLSRKEAILIIKKKCHRLTMQNQ